MFTTSRTTALLPATMSLFGKKKATLQEAATIWKNSTVQVMKLNNDKLRFVIGYGSPKGYNPLFEAHHDQTGARLGNFEQIGTLFIDAEGTVCPMDSNSEQFLDAKAPILVYK